MEIVDLHVRRLVKAFVDCKSWLRIFTISLNKMTMGNRKNCCFIIWHAISFGVSMFCADLANEVIFLETAIKFGSSIRLLFLTVFESQTIWI